MLPTVRRLLLAAALSCCAFAQTSDRDRIQFLIANYAQSVDNADTGLAARIWSHSTDVSFVYPLGRERGFDQIRQNVYIGAMEGLFSDRKLQIHDVSIHVAGSSAWAEFDWEFTANSKKDGSAVSTKGRETQVYQKEKTGWLLVHVHYSERQ